MKTTAPGEDEARLTPQVERLLMALGRVLNTAAVYGMEHARSQRTVDEAHDVLVVALAEAPRIRLDVAGERLLVGGRRAPPGGPLIRSLVTRLAALGITGFSMVKGMTREELDRLLCVIATSRPGSFEKALGDASLEHVRAEKMEWKAAGDGHGRATPARDTAGSGSGSGRGAAGGSGRPGVLDLGDEDVTLPGPGASIPPPAPAPRPAGAGVSQIIAFLKGEPSSQSAAEEVARLMNEPERLAKLILEASAIRQADPAVQGGESMADLILGCLRRTYEGLRQMPLPIEEDGPLEARKSLLLLEKSILDRLRQTMGRPDPGTDAAIRAAMRGMTEDLELDFAAAQYVEERAAVVRSERRIMDYLRHREPEGVKKQLAAAGLPAEDWQRLMIRSGSDSTGMNLPTGIGALAMVLERFDALMRSESKRPEEVQAHLSEVDQGVRDVAHRTDARLDALDEEVQSLRRSDVSRREDRERLMGSLAEIAQELLQPLTVVNCSLQMLLDGFLGTVPPDHADILRLAVSSSGRMKDLMDRLIAIVGYPAQETLPR